MFEVRSPIFNWDSFALRNTVNSPQPLYRAGESSKTIAWPLSRQNRP